MIDSARQAVKPQRRGHTSARRMCAAGGTFALAGLSAATIALAAGTAVSVDSASNAKLGEQVAVNSQGRTLYALSPETTSHLLCKSRECLKFWPPLTVPSRNTELKDGPGVHGHLGILHRSNGMLQVTLRGLPLYRFSEDHAKGQVNGQGIESFGGTWHAVTASTSSTPTPPASPPPANPAPPVMPGYQY